MALRARGWNARRASNSVGMRREYFKRRNKGETARGRHLYVLLCNTVVNIGNFLCPNVKIPHTNNLKVNILKNQHTADKRTSFNVFYYTYSNTWNSRTILQNSIFYKTKPMLIFTSIIR